MQEHSFRSFLVRLFFVALAAVLVIYVEHTLFLAQTASGILAPIVGGGAAAFVLSIPLSWLEKHWFPKSRKPFVNRTRRGACIALVLLCFAALLAALARLIVPNFTQALTILARAVPAYAESVRGWILQNADRFPELAQWAETAQINWKTVTDTVVQFLRTGASDSVLSNTATLIGGVLGTTVDVILAVIFTIYFLAGKEGVYDGTRRLMRSYLLPDHERWLQGALRTANEVFRSFIVGQVTEAVVLGGLCALGMMVFRFPYVTLVSVFVGVTALIPLVGAYAGAIFGALMIFTVDPVKALWFLVFLIVLQQIEGNLIYPRVVGSSLRLTGVWVLAAVTVFGGLGGIPGILLGVPLTALIYRLVRQDMDGRINQKPSPNRKR